MGSKREGGLCRVLEILETGQCFKQSSNEIRE